MLRMYCIQICNLPQLENAPWRCLKSTLIDFGKSVGTVLVKVLSSFRISIWTAFLQMCFLYFFICWTPFHLTLCDWSLPVFRGGTHHAKEWPVRGRQPAGQCKWTPALSFSLLHPFIFTLLYIFVFLLLCKVMLGLWKSWFSFYGIHEHESCNTVNYRGPR